MLKKQNWIFWNTQPILLPISKSSSPKEPKGWRNRLPCRKSKWGFRYDSNSRLFQFKLWRARDNSTPAPTISWKFAPSIDNCLLQLFWPGSFTKGKLPPAIEKILKKSWFLFYWTIPHFDIYFQFHPEKKLISISRTVWTGWKSSRSVSHCPPTILCHRIDEFHIKLVIPLDIQKIAQGTSHELTMNRKAVSSL